MAVTYKIRKYSKNYWQILAKGLSWKPDNASHPIDFVYGNYEDALARLFEYLNLLRYVGSLRENKDN